MKITQWFACLFPGGKTISQTPKTPAPDDLNQPPTEPVPEVMPYADDASPPGHKVRWHH